MGNFVDVQVLSRSRLEFIFSNGDFEGLSGSSPDLVGATTESGAAPSEGKIVATVNDLLSHRPNHVPGYDERGSVDPVKLEAWQSKTDESLETLQSQLREVIGLLQRQSPSGDILSLAEDTVAR